jgi:hypothetical protein
MCSDNVKASEIYIRMTVQYGGNCISPREVYECMERFKGVGMTVVADAHSGRLSTITCRVEGADQSTYPR